jgi:cytochrome c oxidase cbb3-type subunit I/II
MATNEIDFSDLPAKIRTIQKLGVPYPEGYDQIVMGDVNAQAGKIVGNLKEAGVEVLPNTEIVALIAYLQRLGTDIKANTAEN